MSVIWSAVGGNADIGCKRPTLACVLAGPVRRATRPGGRPPGVGSRRAVAPPGAQLAGPSGAMGDLATPDAHHLNLTPRCLPQSIPRASFVDPRLAGNA